LFALCEAGFKRDGYFVEFGATDGVNGRNSYLLEKNFGWKGVVAEPARCWYEQLRANRACSIDTEGSELEILRSFDFSQYRIHVIACEHDYTPAREDIHRLLMEKGYERRYESLSLMDDWYVRVRTY
jgi:hypothetical protein